jgi:hypothetical protein
MDGTKVKSNRMNFWYVVRSITDARSIYMQSPTLMDQQEQPLSVQRPTFIWIIVCLSIKAVAQTLWHHLNCQRRFPANFRLPVNLAFTTTTNKTNNRHSPTEA